MAGPLEDIMAALWRTKAWRLFPLLLVYMLGTTLLNGRGGRAEEGGVWAPPLGTRLV